MDPESKKYGKGPRELTGAVDLITHFNLSTHRDFFCKRPLPLSIADTHYLHHVADSEIRKGEGMKLSQLMENGSNVRYRTVKIRPFDMDTLVDVFRFRESGPIDLPNAEKGTPTIAGKSKNESKDKNKKHKKHKDRDKEKSKEHKKHKHRHKDRCKDKDSEKKKDRSWHHDSNAEHSKKHHDKKRNHEGSDNLIEIQKHKKSKHRSSKIDQVGAIKVAV